MKTIVQERNGMRDDSAFWGLYKLGGAAAITAAVIFRRNLDAEWLLLRAVGIVDVGPIVSPSSISDWFMLLQQQPLLGLTLLNLFDLVNYVLVGAIILALIVALRRTNPTWLLIAAGLGAAGVMLYLVSNQAISLLSLSRQYAAATSESQRAMILASGQAVLAIHQSASYAERGIYLSFLLVSTAGLMISITMLKNSIFNTGTAVIGILANSFQLGYYIVLVFAPGFVAAVISISAVFVLIWYIQVGVRLWRIGSQKPDLAHSIKSI